MNERNCPFCRKIERIEELDSSEAVWPFPHSVALLGTWQFYQGYCVLVSRRHASELNELPADERHAYFEEMCLLAQAIQMCYRPHKLNYEILGNQVPHLHWHLFPRYQDDPDRLAAVWLALARAERGEGDWRQRMETGREDRAATTANLRRTLQELNAPQA